MKLSVSTFLRAALFVSACALPGVAAAHEFKLGAITIDHPWARASTVKVSAAYLTLKIDGAAADRLVKAASPVAGRVELHTMAIENGVARMREVKQIAVSPGTATELKPGGFHIMLMDLKRPLTAGESIKLTLTFEKAGTIEVDAPVEAAGSPGTHKH